MKITCPNCQKIYTIDQAKIPPGIKSAKCKACGHPMPLKKAASAKPSPNNAIIKRSCLYCGQVHTLVRAKLAPDVLTINCKSCNRPVPVKLDESADLVPSLNKDASNPPAAKPAIRPAVQPSRPPDILTITCAGCAKSYKIRRKMIPPTAKTLKCKACGHPMGLPTANGLSLKNQPAPSDAMPAVDLAWMPIRRYALAAGIILAVMLGVFSGYRFFKDQGRGQFAPVSAKQRAVSAALLEAGPFLAFNLNIPQALDILDRRVENDQKTPGVQTTMALVKPLKLRRLELYLYADDKNRILPVILTRDSDAGHLETLLTRQESFKKYFERISPGNFRLKKEALDEADKYNFPGGPYQLLLVDKGAMLAPQSFTAAITADKRLLRDTEVSRIGQSVSDPNDLARIAVRVPANMQKGWEKKIQENPSLKDNPQVAMLAGRGAGLLSQLTDALKTVEVMALGFRFAAQNVRTLSYAQRFRAGVDGGAVYRWLKSGDFQDVEVESVIRTLVELFRNRRYGHSLQFKDNRLDLEFSWLKKDDQTLLTALSDATLEQTSTQSLARIPTPELLAAE